MYTGFIRTFGRKAVTIEDCNKRQYYAVMEDVDKYVKEHLEEPLPHLPVKFIIDIDKIAGVTTNGPRYHAKEVKLDVEF